jgi:hypothetical protein
MITQTITTDQPPDDYDDDEDDEGEDGDGGEWCYCPCCMSRRRPSWPAISAEEAARRREERRGREAAKKAAEEEERRLQEGDPKSSAAWKAGGAARVRGASLGWGTGVCAGFGFFVLQGSLT